MPHAARHDAPQPDDLRHTLTVREVEPLLAEAGVHGQRQGGSHQHGQGPPQGRMVANFPGTRPRRQPPPATRGSPGRAMIHRGDLTPGRFNNDILCDVVPTHSHLGARLPCTHLRRAHTASPGSDIDTVNHIEHVPLMPATFERH